MNYQLILTFVFGIALALVSGYCFYISDCLQEANRDLRRSLTYAQAVAMNMHNRHYSHLAPDWEGLDDLPGVLSQIDNMAAGLKR